MQVRRCCQAEDDLPSLGFNELLAHPGFKFAQWAQIMLDNYPDTITDAFMFDKKDNRELSNADLLFALWQSHYTDPGTGLTYPIEKWAKIFATKEAVQMYHDLTTKPNTNKQ